MVLLIKDSDIAALAPMREVVEATEIAFKEHAEGLAPFHPRRITIRNRTADGQVGYRLNTQIGSVSRFDLTAVRLMSGPMGVKERRGEARGVHNAGGDGNDWGLCVLFDMRTAAPAAILPQFSLSGIRVGATTGVGVKHLAREDAETVGIFGSSKVARADLEAAACVRKFRRAMVYSPKPEHRRDFAGEMSRKLDLDVVPTADPRQLVTESDVILVSTSANEPVFDGGWLVPGQFVSTTKSTPLPRKALSPGWAARAPDTRPLEIDEIDRKTLTRADFVCILSQEMAMAEDQRDLLDPIEAGELSWEQCRELGDIVAGRRGGRTRADELIVMKSTGGVGIQMAAIGSVVLRHAAEKGVGKKIDDAWFGADMALWHEKGFYPTP
jgi:ornithine cyclodeaminase/alanine dehydrogenase-like protein (mu-crystallin family)